MKTLISILLTVFIFLLPSLEVSGGGLFAQDSRLFDNTWFLQKLEIEGVDHFPPSNAEVEFVGLNFYDNSINEFDTFVCNSFFGELEYDSTHSFTILNSAMTLILCNIEENGLFEGVYFGFFSDNHDTSEEPFPYTITTTGSDKSLIVTNNRGDKAFYGNQALSNNVFGEIGFSIYPNPVKNTLTIQNMPASFIEATVILYNINGKLVTTVSIGTENSNLSINVSNLNSGIYFLNVTIKNGQSQILRLVKE